MRVAEYWVLCVWGTALSGITQIGQGRCTEPELQWAREKYEWLLPLLNKSACVKYWPLPTSWKKALLSVISRKQSKPLDPSVWRTIAKKSYCYKTLGHLIARLLMGLLKIYLCISIEQCRFATGHSIVTTCDKLLQEAQDVRRSLTQGFRDFQSAFDMVPVDKILIEFDEYRWQNNPVRAVHLMN